MAHAFHAIAFTDAVKACQMADGSRNAYARFEDGPVTGDRIGPDEAAFIGARDHVYVASVGADGWPYIQHRGGPAGFVKALDEKTLGFADFRGNRQLISTGNVAGNDRVAMFFIDYAHQTRLKLVGRARVLPAADDPALAARLAMPGYDARIERLFLVEVAGLDWNCPQHITPRFTEAEVLTMVQPLKERLRRLESELAALRGG